MSNIEVRVELNKFGVVLHGIVVPSATRSRIESAIECIDLLPHKRYITQKFSYAQVVESKPKREF